MDRVHIEPRRDFIESIRREVSSCIEVSDSLKVKRWDPGLLWKVPFLLLSRPWREAAHPTTTPERRVEGVDVDLWCAFGCNAASARLVATGTLQAKPVILFLGSNADIAFPPSGNEEAKDKYGESYTDRRFALTRAAKVVCQSQWQLNQLRVMHSIEGTVIKSPIDILEWSPKEPVPRSGVLWVGRYDDFHKRVHLAIQIAKLCPEIHFKLIINPSNVEIEKQIRQECPHNATIIDYVPFDKMNFEFRSSQLLLSTGHPNYEGFPNVLLQAAASKTPIVSLYDFDDFLAQSGAGVVCHDSPELAASRIRDMAADDKTDWNHVHKYLQERHSIDAISANLCELIESTVEGYAAKSVTEA